MTKVYKVKNKKTGLFLKSRTVPSDEGGLFYLADQYLWESLGHGWKRLATAKQRYHALAVLEDHHKNKSIKPNFTIDDIEIVKFELQLTEVDLDVNLAYERDFALAFDRFRLKSKNGTFHPTSSATDRAMLSYLGLEDPYKYYSYVDWSKADRSFTNYPKKRKQSDKDSWKCYSKYPIMCVKLKKRDTNKSKIKSRDIKTKLDESGYNCIVESNVFYFESIEPTVLLYLTSDPDTQYFIFKYNKENTELENFSRMGQEYINMVSKG